ncbi:hypothetical protein LINPERHAP2_LOCUS13451, partial [Linum perenne]
MSIHEQHLGTNDQGGLVCIYDLQIEQWIFDTCDGFLAMAVFSSDHCRFQVHDDNDEYSFQLAGT